MITHWVGKPLPIFSLRQPTGPRKSEQFQSLARERVRN